MEGSILQNTFRIRFDEPESPSPHDDDNGSLEQNPETNQGGHSDVTGSFISSRRMKIIGYLLMIIGFVVFVLASFGLL